MKRILMCDCDKETNGRRDLKKFIKIKNGGTNIKEQKEKSKEIRKKLEGDEKGLQRERK